MPANSLLTGRILVFALAGLLAVGPAFAEKPSWAGQKGEKGSKGQRSEQSEGRDEARGRDTRVAHFADPHRSAVRDYYGSQFQSGRCPPGLAKKHNGCMPSGQAKK